MTSPVAAAGYMQKARRAACCALLLARKDTEGACNRVYYAMFDAAHAADYTADPPADPDTREAIEWPVGTQINRLKALKTGNIWPGPAQNFCARESCLSRHQPEI